MEKILAVHLRKEEVLWNQRRKGGRRMKEAEEGVMGASRVTGPLFYCLLFFKVATF